MTVYGIRITADKEYFNNPAIQQLRRLAGDLPFLEESLEAYFRKKYHKGVEFKYTSSEGTGTLEIIAPDEESACAVLKFYEIYLPKASMGMGKENAYFKYIVYGNRIF